MSFGLCVTSSSFFYFSSFSFAILFCVLFHRRPRSMQNLLISSRSIARVPNSEFISPYLYTLTLQELSPSPVTRTHAAGYSLPHLTDSTVPQVQFLCISRFVV